MSIGKFKAAILPKVIGADTEYGNYIIGSDNPGGSGMRASTLLLERIAGVPADSTLSCSWPTPYYGSVNQWGHFTSSCGDGGYVTGGSGQTSACNPQDMGRKFLPENGGSAYIDLSHLELCIPELMSARDFVKYKCAFHEIAARACAAANGDLSHGQSLHVHANNSDGLSNSYGSHLNFLISRRCFENIFQRKLQNLMFLASYQSSSIICTGQGKVGSENSREWTDFQISQRSDFIETIVGEQTTFNRPLVNSRDESHARDDMARLHVIFYDSPLCQVSSFLQAGVMQIILSMLEAEVINNDLILDDALQALSDWSGDISLRKKARTLGKKECTALEHQCALFKEARKFVASGAVDDEVIPEVDEILHLWGDTLNLLEARDFQKLSSRLDWVLKVQFLEGVKQERSLSWKSPEMKHLDLMYSCLDRDRGLYRQWEHKGFVEKIVSEKDIEESISVPPDNTRAWFRSWLLKHAAEEMIEIESVDWDSIVFRIHDDHGGGYRPSRRVRVNMDNPLGFTERECASLIRNSSSVHDVIMKTGKEVISHSGSAHSFP